MMSTLLKLGLSGYDVKPRFGVFKCEYRLQNPLFFEEKILVTLDTHTKRMNPPSIILGGGVQGSATRYNTNIQYPHNIITCIKNSVHNYNIFMFFINLMSYSYDMICEK